MSKINPSESGELKSPVGVIGLGVMGTRMTKNLLRAGYQVVVFSRSPGPVSEMARAGAVPANSSEEVARKCKVIILSLTNSDAVRQVVLGERGLIQGLSSGSVVVDTSTTDPELPLEISSELSRKGSYFLDAPVSGGPEGAEKGTLTVMVGGETAALQKCVRVLEAIGKSINHLGPSGTGQKVKLFNQALVAVYFGAVSEAYGWSRSLGLNPDDLLEVISKSWGDSPVFRHFISVIKSGDFRDGASVRLYTKDMAIILSNADKHRSQLPLLKLASELFRKASEMGHDTEDASVLYPALYWRQQGD